VRMSKKGNSRKEGAAQEVEDTIVSTMKEAVSDRLAGL